MKKITFLFLLLTLCFTLNAQVLTEGFEAGIPAGWTQTQITGTTNWTAAANNQNSTIQPRTGTQMAYFFVGNYVNRTRLETPALDVTTVSTPVLTFYYTNVDWGGDTEELRVFYKNSAGGSWTQLAAYTATVGVWTEVNIVLPNPTNDYYIGFEAKANWGRGLTLDDILVDELSGCLPPGSLSVLPTSTTDADLSWIGAGSETDWTYEYGTTGYVQGTGQISGGSVIAETASISGLTSGVVYDFYVQANCGGTDGDSAYTGPYTWTQPDTGEACGTAIVAALEADCGTATPLTLDFSLTTTSGGGSCDTFNNIGYWVTTTTDASGGLTINASAAVDVVIFSNCTGAEEECYGGGITPSVDVVLSPNTQYYMYFWNETGSTASVDVCISSYTPAPAPECATTPNPEDGAIDVPNGDVTFTWVAPTTGPTPTSYNMYAGETPTGDDYGLIGNFTTTEALITITGYDVQLYWKVVPLNGSTEATGCPVWSFTTESAPPPPVNDLLANAIAINCGDDVMGTTLFATQDEASAPDVATVEVDTSADNDSPWVWYSFTGSGLSEEITLSTCGVTNTDFDTEIFVYTGTSGSLTLIDDGYDECGGSTENYAAETNFISDGTTTYYIAVGGYDSDDTGNFHLSVNCVTLSAETFNLNDLFSYYPNPVNNSLTLKGAKTIQDVTVYNMLGQEVLRTSPNTLNSDVDMSILNAGTYFVKVTVDNATKTIKVIKK